MGKATRLRSRTRARVARADDDRAPARDPELDHLRLRMGVAAASTRLPRGNAGRRSGLDPARAAQELRRGAAEAAAVPGPEGGVLPLGFRARRRRPRRLVDRSREGACRAAAPTRRFALPPTFEPALSDDARASRTTRGRARLRDPTHGRAARLREVARAAFGDRSRTFRRRAEPD